MHVTIAKNTSGCEEIHRAGCADLRPRSHRLADAMTVEADTLRDVYAAYWDCIADTAADEGDYPTADHALYAWRTEFSVKPCAAKLTPMTDPAA